VDEPRDDNQSGAGDGPGSVAQDRPQQISVAARPERVQREPHEVHDQERDPEDDTVTAEGVGDGQRGDEHRRHGNQHRSPDHTPAGINGVGQPGVGSPRPPERGEDQETVSEPTPGRVIRQDGRDLREPEDEDEVEEELERSDPLLALDVLFAHSRTLARTNRDRELTLGITIAAVAYDEELAGRIRELVGSESGLTEQKMFGGLAFLIGGNMAVAASGQGGILVRVEPGQSDTLVATTDARLMEMRGRSMQGWLRVDPEHVRSERQLAKWVELGTTYARSLPAKR
jgi:hypothetical protein